MGRIVKGYFINSYQIKIFNRYGYLLCTLYENGANAMEATETAFRNFGSPSPSQPLIVVAINVLTGLSFKFEVAQAS